MRASVLPSPLPDSADSLRLLLLSDLHLGVKPAAACVLREDQECWRRTDFTVLLGDQTAAWGTDDEYREVDDFVAALPRPYDAINGNHEFYFEVVPDGSVPAGRVFKQASPALKGERLEKFRRFYGHDQLWRAQRTSLGVFLFLSLDDVDHPRPEALSGPQQEFLENVLRQSAEVPVYVFCHAPLSLGRRLDMVYYDETRTACVELKPALRQLCEARRLPLFWISGHIHLRPDHYLYPAYPLADAVWQVHCPDAIGYSRWNREQVKPEFHDGLYSRSLEITSRQVALVTRDHVAQAEMARQVIEF